MTCLDAGWQQAFEGMARFIESLKPSKIILFSGYLPSKEKPF